MSPPPGAVLTTVDEIIDALGGTEKLAETFGFKDYRAVAMWRTRKTISPLYRPRIKEMLETAGFRVPDDYLDPPRRGAQAQEAQS